MKITTCLHFKSPLRKRGAERTKLNNKTFFPDRELNIDLV